MKHKKFDLEKAMAGDPIVMVTEIDTRPAKLLERTGDLVFFSVKTNYAQWDTVLSFIDKNGNLKELPNIFMEEQEPEPEQEEPEFFFNVYNKGIMFFVHKCKTLEEAKGMVVGANSNNYFGTFSSKSAIKQTETRKYYMAIKHADSSPNYYTSHLYDKKQDVLKVLNNPSEWEIIEVEI